MGIDNSRNHITHEPTNCTCLLLVTSLAVYCGLTKLAGLPNVVLPTERFVCNQRCGNFPFGQDELNRSLGIAPAKDDLGTK